MTSAAGHERMCPPRSRRARGDVSPMRRTPRASAIRLCGRIGIGSLAFGVRRRIRLRARHREGARRTRSARTASPALVAAVANVNQKLQDLGARIQTQQESVNKSLVDVQNARDAAAAAQQAVDANQAQLKDANAGDRGRAAALRHVRLVDLRERTVGVLRHGNRSRRRHRHRRDRRRRWPSACRSRSPTCSVRGPNW